MNKQDHTQMPEDLKDTTLLDTKAKEIAANKRMLKILIIAMIPVFFMMIALVFFIAPEGFPSNPWIRLFIAMLPPVIAPTGFWYQTRNPNNN